MKLDTHHCQQYLKTATCTFRRLLAADKRFAQRVRKLMEDLSYPLVDRESKRNSRLVSFYGAYGGCGIVLLANQDGSLELGVSVYPDRRSFFPTLWKGHKKLPAEFVKVLSTLRTQKKVREIFKGL